ncbi:hypothetical protein [Zoogloea sp.]|uniref:hypothetical protein n=1 Tax=Zoogloea sp. TaxID=49181 RepID=UPI0035B05A00
MSRFDIPVVVFFFKRVEKTQAVIRRIAEIRPSKLYLICDGGRTPDEDLLVRKCREGVEAQIDWPCEVVRNYAESNRGVYDRIGLGAKWVLSQEKSAIFLEDDNLPEVTFFRFCEEMLERYADESRVLWVCGTNYLQEYQPSDGSSYVFSQHMLPCGWASWSHKFARYYDGDLELVDDPYLLSRVRDEYKDDALYHQDKDNWLLERRRVLSGIPPKSWDYQMSFTQRVHGLLAVVPMFNQIRNIGVDEHSIHGGTSMSDVMTSRFCELRTRALEWPLVHPRAILTDLRFERLIDGVVLYPFSYRAKGFINRLLKRIFLVSKDESLTASLKSRFFFKSEK